MQTKAVLTGTFSSGKTTLLKLFQNRAFIIPEVAKELLEIKPQLFNEPELQQIILAEQLRREQDAEKNNNPLIICDRGVIDVIVYSRYFRHPEPKTPFYYDRIFLCSPEGVPCIYGEQAKIMRQNLHQIFLNVLGEQNLSYRVLEGTPEERYRTIENELYGRGIEGNPKSWQEKK